MQTLFISTWLYIKQHSVTGLKYFGKTTKEDPTAYTGSGKYWKDHLRVHGKEHVKTIWCQLFTTPEELTLYALTFSKQNNIVKSTEWANLIIEDGFGGGRPGMKLSEESRKKISEKNKGKRYRAGFKNSAEHNEILRLSRIGSHHTDEVKAQISSSKLGRKNTIDHNLKISETMKGRPGKPMTEDHKKKLLSANLGKKHTIVTCPHCSKSGGGGAMKQYHFDRCKLKIS